MHNITTADLRQYVLNRNELPESVCEHIRNEKSNHGSQVHAWFTDTEKKLSAKGVDVDWWALFEDMHTAESASSHTTPDFSAGDIDGLRRRLELARTCRVPRWSRLPEMFGCVRRLQFWTGTRFGLSQFWKLTRDTNPLIWQIVLERFDRASSIPYTLFPIRILHGRTVIQQLDAAAIQHLYEAAHDHRVDMVSLGEEILLLSMDSPEVFQKYAHALLSDSDSACTTFERLESRIHAKSGSRARVIAELIVESVLSLPESDYSKVTWHEKDCPELLKAVRCRFAAASTNDRRSLLGLASRCELTTDSLVIVRDAARVGDVNDQLLQLLSMISWRTHVKSRILQDFAREAVRFAVEETRDVTRETKYRKDALSLAATVYYCRSSYDQELLDLVRWCLHDETLVAHAAEISLRVGDPRLIQEVLASSLFSLDEVRREACLKLLAKCDDTDAVRGFLQYIESPSSARQREGYERWLASDETNPFRRLARAIRENARNNDAAELLPVMIEAFDEMIATLIYTYGWIKDEDSRAKDMLSKIDSELLDDTIDNAVASTQQDHSQPQLESVEFVEAMRRFVKRYDEGKTLQQRLLPKQDEEKTT